MTEPSPARPDRERIVERYSELARSARAGRRVVDCDEPAFGDGCFGAAAYTREPDVPADALRVSLGCGNPLSVADLHDGERVLDLGSGGGLDVVLSARRVGASGHVYGLDASDEMLRLARANAAAAGVSDVEFLHGFLEDIPLRDAAVDVVISNCVISLSADKHRVLAEAFRVLAPGGRLGISDIVADDTVPADDRAGTQARTGCAVDALTRADYLDALAAVGFEAAEVTFTQAHGDGVHSAMVRATKPNDTRIRAMSQADAPAVLAIYQAGLDTGEASFETTAPAWPAWDAAHLPDHRFVAVDVHDRVLGWVACTGVSDRCVYHGVVEHSVYVHPDARGHGIGRALLAALVESTESAGIWTIQSGIFPENTGSIAVHRRAGFRVVGTRERVGRHNGRWRDVTQVERRSSVAGVADRVLTVQPDGTA